MKAFLQPLQAWDHGGPCEKATWQVNASKAFAPPREQEQENMKVNPDRRGLTCLKVMCQGREKEV